MKYITDKELEYSRIRWQYKKGDCFELDEYYRTTQFPFIAPNHPLVCKECSAGIYQMGKYKETRYSLVLPLYVDELLASPAFREVNRAFLSSNFTTKIAWQMIERRRDVIHTTIFGGLTKSQLPEIASKLNKFIAEYGFPSYRIGGPMIGERNRGRIYLPIYPEVINNQNAFHLLQTIIERPLTNIYLVGYYNLTDFLDQNQTFELHEILVKYQSTTLLEAKSKAFWLIGTNDDLLLSGKLEYTIE